MIFIRVSPLNIELMIFNWFFSSRKRTTTNVFVL